MPEKVRALKELVEALDGCRVGRCGSLSKVERLVAELGLKLPYDWQEIKRDAQAILALPATSPEYRRLKRLDRWATSLTRLNLVLLVSAIVAYLARFWFASALLDIVALALILTALAIANAAYAMRVYVSIGVDRIYAERVAELEKLGRRLREVVDYLIRLLRRELRAGRYDLEAFTLRLWVPDYSGVKIVRKPGRLSSRYLVRLA